MRTTIISEHYKIMSDWFIFWGYFSDWGFYFQDFFSIRGLVSLLGFTIFQSRIIIDKIIPK